MYEQEHKYSKDTYFCYESNFFEGYQYNETIPEKFDCVYCGATVLKSN